MPRTAADDNGEIVRKRLAAYADTKFDVGVDPYSGEQADFLWTLGTALKNAGWIWKDWRGEKPGEKLHRVKMGGNPWVASLAAGNVEIHLAESTRTRLLPAARALVNGLDEIGIDAHETSTPNVWNTEDGRLHILIGDRM